MRFPSTVRRYYMGNENGPGRYCGRETDSGEIVIYDVENEDAWIRSDTAIHRSWNA